MISRIQLIGSGFMAAISYLALALNHDLLTIIRMG
jgi:hypothetical protein